MLDIDEAKVQRNEFGMWLGWTLATAAGMLLGFAPFYLFIEEIPLWLARIVIPVVAGFLVGLFQWLVLRNYVTYSVDWILSGGAAWSLAFALGLIVIQLLRGSFIGALLGYLLFGLIIAVIQWPVLRREIPNVLPWALASIVGWALGAFLSQVLLNTISGGAPIEPLVSSAVASSVTGLVAGAVTGLAMVWIVRKPELE